MPDQDTLPKICSKCSNPFPATTEFFGADKTRKDGLHPQCKECKKTKQRESVAAAKREGLTEEEQTELDRLSRRVIAAYKVLDDPKASSEQLRKADIEIRTTVPKKRRKLDEQIAERKNLIRQAELGVVQAQELARVRADLDAAPRDLAALKSYLAGLPSDDDCATARQFVESRIESLEDAIREQCDSERARIEALTRQQDEIDRLEAAKEVAAIVDWVKPYLFTPHLAQEKRSRLREHCLAMVARYKDLERAELEKEKEPGNEGGSMKARLSVVARRCAGMFKKLAGILEPITEESISKKPETYFTSDFACSKVNWEFRTTRERALLRHFTIKCVGEKWAHELPDAPPPIFLPEKPVQSLEGIRDSLASADYARADLEEMERKRQKYWEDLKGTNPKQFEKESKNAILQIKGGGLLEQNQRETLQALKERDPEEFERISLQALEPRSYEPQCIVYLVPTWTHAQPRSRANRDEQYWPCGDQVKSGQIFYDFLLKGWYRAPEPADQDIDFSKQTGPTKAELQKLSPEAQEFYRDADVSATASSVFARPEKITFMKGDRHVQGSGRDYFRHGHWWSKEEIDKVESGPPLAEPPLILSPMPRLAVADCIATKPETAADIAKDRREPYCWRRLEQKRKVDAEREATFLNG